MIVSFIFAGIIFFGLILRTNTQPVTVAILQTMQFDQVNWGVMARPAFTIIPGLLVASYFERYLVNGRQWGNDNENSK